MPAVPDLQQHPHSAGSGKTRSANDAKIINLARQEAASWKLPYSIDDEDLTFDGKPLNLLYEENRWKAEHHHVQYTHSSRDEHSWFASVDRVSPSLRLPVPGEGFDG